MVTSGSKVVRCAACGTKNQVPSAASGIPRCAKCKSLLPWIGEAGDDTFADVVTASVIPVLVDIWAPWCGPCRMVSPALEHLAGEMAGRIKLVKVNADDAPRVSARFGIQAIPTLLVMRGDQVLARQTGAAPEDTLRTWLEGVLPTASSQPG
ncbi:MAG TPA: thioredoxin [Acidimicrobiales bacterium]|nr:thioredoxin [Acidimicrobiales bacterium]